MKIVIKWGLCPHPRQGRDHREAQGRETLPKGPTNKKSLATTLFLLNDLNTMHLSRLEVTEFLWRALCLFLTRTSISFQITVLSVTLSFALCHRNTQGCWSHRNTCVHEAPFNIHTRSVCTLTSAEHWLTCLYFSYLQSLQVTNYLLKFNHQLVYSKNITLKLL